MSLVRVHTNFDISIRVESKVTILLCREYCWILVKKIPTGRYLIFNAHFSWLVNSFLRIYQKHDQTKFSSTITSVISSFFVTLIVLKIFNLELVRWRQTTLTLDILHILLHTFYICLDTEKLIKQKVLDVSSFITLVMKSVTLTFTVLELFGFI